jgi:hypothetical protein
MTEYRPGLVHEFAAIGMTLKVVAIGGPNVQA